MRRGKKHKPDAVPVVLESADKALKIIEEEGALNSVRIIRILYDIAQEFRPFNYKAEISKILQGLYGVELEKVSILKERLGVGSVHPEYRQKWLYYLDCEGLKKWFSEHQ